MANTVLITGSSSGIGRATAGCFHERGWNVAATMRDPDAEHHLNTLSDVLVTRLDVTDPASIDRAVAATRERFGTVDVLVNNAGYAAYGILEAFSMDRVDRQFRTNVLGLIATTKAVLPHMRERRSGVIVNVSSIGGRMTFPLGTLYHGSKFAVEGLSESLHYELAPLGIRVKIIEPAPLDTNFGGRSLDFANDESLTDYQPVVGAVLAGFDAVARTSPGPEVAAETIFAADPGTTVLLHDLGIPAARVLRRAGLPGDLLSRGPVTLPAAGYFAFWQALDDEAGGPEVAVRIGRVLSAEVFMPALFAALCSPDLTVAARRIAEYKDLIGPMRLIVGEHTVAYRFPPGPEPPPALILTELVFWTVLARIGTRHDVRPLRVHSPCLPGDQTSFVDFLGVPVEYASTPSVTFAAYDMNRPFMTANESMWKFFEPELRRRLAAFDRDVPTAERVRAELLRMLPAGQGTMADVAQSLSVSTRTLQRRLRDEETTFQNVLATTRTQLARHYLTIGDLSADQISFLLGYDDPKSFYRAFRTWTGVTPTHARAVHIRSLG